MSLVERARELDAADPLAFARERFVLDPAVTYLDGNSLGALPRGVAERVAEVITQDWGQLRIRSWTERGWWAAPERVGDRIAPLLGVPAGHVVVGDSTSITIFRALVALWRMVQADGPGRTEIVVDASTFPTDAYLADSVARLTDAAVVRVDPDRLPTLLGDRTAVVLLNHVDYRTGRRHDLPELTAAVHAAGARIVWDLSHSAGVMPLDLADNAVDIALGCAYKYLNGGPGAPSYLYVRDDLLPRLDQPLAGWCSHRDPFAMEPDYRAATGITAARGGTPEILSLLALEAALDVWDGVELAAVRTKSLALTDFFLECVADETVGAVACITPAGHRRGGQLSLTCENAEKVMAALIGRGVVGDFRPPDILRFGFSPLYNGFSDAHRAARVLGEVLE
jgi:kynureninase